MTEDTERMIVTIVVVVVLGAEAYASQFRTDVLAILTTALAWTLGFWFGSKSNNGPSIK